MTREDREKKYQGKKCICGDIHLFEDDPYINSKTRRPGWTEDRATREMMRAQVQKSAQLYHAVKKSCNINFLDGVDPPRGGGSFRKPRQSANAV